ncbi:copper chaperone for superoxide dismutase-like [Clytia hemisphaerica]|uniref:Superoxide dismutase copper chaperone n=1 Tax=Clytia hemisphaerica TaxID=252671 RepID=A0A7M5WIF8_9CNID
MWRQFILFANCSSSSISNKQQTTKMAEVSSVIEFNVNMTCGNCENSIRDSLSKLQGITSVTINIQQQQVIVTTTYPSEVVQKAIESTGMLAIVKGQGLDISNHMGAAISILKRNQRTLGLVRFTQITEETCVIDGSFNGLNAGKYGLHIHQFGDLSSFCESTGDDYNPTENCHGDRENTSRHAGDMGNVEVGEKGSAVFRYQDNMIKVWDIIGRSVVLHEKEDDFSNDPHGNAGKGLACGIIARSAGLFQNKKMVCSCSGKTIWQEREDAKNEMG